MQAKEMANFRSYKNQLLKSNGDEPQDGSTDPDLNMSNFYEIFEMEDEEAKQQKIRE